MEDPLHSLIDTDEILQPYMAAAKDFSNVSTLRSLILKVFSDPNVFAGYNNIHALVKGHLQGSPDGDKMLNTLDLFSYGSFSDYMSSPDKFIPLNESQVFKLKQLTALTIIEQACRAKQNSVYYDVIQQALNLETPTEVEHLLVSCIYSRVLVGKLNQKNKKLQLIGTYGPPLCPRDVPVTSVADMLSTLRAIKSNIAECQLDLNKQRVQIQKEQNAQSKFFKQADDRVRRTENVCSGTSSLVPNLQAQRRGSGWGAMSAGGGAAAVMAGVDDAVMDLGPSLQGRRQKRSRGGLSGGGDIGAGHRS
ncbi:hypothetical protein MPSEU_000501300 [Mayamaea pseudoterrestris]|nr:hypothetical protein MPSEU_000501300 [Mayamaea pseudoterrestris]